MLSKQQIAFYHENGYLTVENVLSAEELAALRQVTDEFVERSRAINSHDHIFDLEANHSAENPRLRRIKSPILHHAVYDATLRHPRILDIVEQLIGAGVRSNGNKLNMKEPDHGSAVEWHQDWAFYPHTNDDLLAVGVAIDDMTEENGCMLMAPGSHRAELHSHHENGVFVGAVSELDFQPRQVAKCLVKAGGITIHHARTLHASTSQSFDKAAASAAFSILLAGFVAPSRASRLTRPIAIPSCAASRLSARASLPCPSSSRCPSRKTRAPSSKSRKRCNTGKWRDFDLRVSGAARNY